MAGRVLLSSTSGEATAAEIPRNRTRYTYIQKSDLIRRYQAMNISPEEFASENHIALSTWYQILANADRFTEEFPNY